MSEITKPILLDDTGKEIKNAILKVSQVIGNDEEIERIEQKVDNVLEDLDNYIQVSEGTEIEVPTMEAFNSVKNETEKLGESLTQVYNDGFASRNLIQDIAQGSWEDNGTPSSSTSMYGIRCRVTNRIKCANGNSFIFSTENNQFEIYARIYDVSGNLLDHFGWTNKFTIGSSKAEYMLVTIRKKDNGSLIPSDIIRAQLEHGTEAHTYTVYAKSNTELTQIVENNIANGYIDKISKVEWSIGGLNFADGLENELNTRARTNFIDVKDIPSLHIEVKSNTQYGVYRYDSNKNFIDYHAWITNVTQTIPNNAKYVRFVTSYTDTSKVISYLSDVSASIYANVPSNASLKQSLSQLRKRVIDFNNTTVIPANTWTTIPNTVIPNGNVGKLAYLRLWVDTELTSSDYVQYGLGKTANNGMFGCFFANSKAQSHTMIADLAEDGYSVMIRSNKQITVGYIVVDTLF